MNKHICEVEEKRIGGVKAYYFLRIPQTRSAVTISEGRSLTDADRATLRRNLACIAPRRPRWWRRFAHALWSACSR